MSTKHEMRIDDLEEEITSLKEQLAEREWVSVEDRLPEYGVQVLTIGKLTDGRSTSPHIEHMFNKFLNPNKGKLVWTDMHVDYWQPLPLPPTGEENG